MAVALIELVGAKDTIPISGALDEMHAQGINLAESPRGMWGTSFTARTIPSSLGGMPGGVDVPVGELVFDLDMWDVGEGAGSPVARVRKLFGSMWHRNIVKWRYTDPVSGQVRWLEGKLARELEFAPDLDWEVDGEARVSVTMQILKPLYESKALTLLAEHPGGGGWQTVWLEVSNPTDQPGWPEWSLIPNGTCKFRFPDFSWDQEQDVDLSWEVGEHDDRMIEVAPYGNGISVRWSVMTEPRMDTYVAADLSNASGQMGGVLPLFPIPPHTKKTVVPVQFNGSDTAQIELHLRRFWSAESGMR
ncbi:MAG TPA: hypothetical protein PKG94_14300 [Gordonia sp. (in: high G+C Gram-positive bacteria)]|nr:hypothetical protein [Gordonia sp. (in: high G+C Gram-positive bacteria)]